MFDIGKMVFDELKGLALIVLGIGALIGVGIASLFWMFFL